MRITAILLSAAIGLAAAPAALAQGEPKTLDVHLADPAWTGDAIPAGQQCQRFGGKGASPKLHIAGAPEGTTAFRVLFNDESFKPMDNGGHGAVRYTLKPAGGQVTLPSVPGETDQLPTGVTTHIAHKAPKWSGTGGAYLPPCSGGKGNTYTATVEALGAGDQVLGRGRVVLGTF